MERKIVSNIENFLKKKFKNKTIKVSARANKPDSAEVIVDDEFVGTIATGINGGCSVYCKPISGWNCDILDNTGNARSLFAIFFK